MSNFWTTVICSALASGGFWAFIQTMVVRRQDRKSNVAIALQCLLRDRIMQAEKEYKTLGYCDSDDKTNVEHMYKAYQALGGNDVAHKAYENIIALPSFPVG